MTDSGLPFRHKPDCLVLFTRFPVPGATKTRLIPALGVEGAASLQKRLTEKIVAEYMLLPQHETNLLIHFCGGDEEQMEQWLGKQSFYRQPDTDLGTRMAHGLQSAAAMGADHILLVGSDIPELTAPILSQGFAALRRVMTVLGPSCDGGFYAIGIPAQLTGELLPDLFADIAWSTSTVFATIRTRLTASGYPPLLLPMLRDIDTPEDLACYQNTDLFR